MKIIRSSDDNYPDDFPPRSYHAWPGNVSKEQVLALEALVERSAGETELDSFLRENPPVLAAALWFARTGHHGAWVVPQQDIRPPQRKVAHGLRPDVIVGGKSSDGFHWAVVEMKGAGDPVFVKKGGRVYFSSVANKAVFQLLEYIDYASRAQAYLRDELGLTDFREPSGVLLIGREAEFQDVQKKRMKAAWNGAAGKGVQIRTYDSLLRDVQSFWGAHGGTRSE